MQGNYELIIVALFAVGSIIVKIVTALKEQAEKKEIKRRRELQDMDNLRTGGRAISEPQAPTSQQTARAALEEMAAKRRAQIEELRRRRAAAAGGGGGQTAPTRAPERVARPQPQQTRQENQTPVTRAPAATVNLPSAEAPVRAPKTQPRPTARPQMDAQQQRDRAKAQELQHSREVADKAQRGREAKQRENRRERANNAAEAKTRAAVQAIENRAAAVRGDVTPEAVATTPAPAAARPVKGKDFILTRGNMRQAIILQEVLAPPLSLRQ